MLLGIISRPSFITSQIPPGTPELWPVNCLKTELAVSALQVEYPAPKNVVLTTNTMGVFCVSLALLFICIDKIFDKIVNLPFKSTKFYLM